MPEGVNAPRAVMLSIGEIASRDQVSKPAVSRKVKQLVAKHQMGVERDGQGRVALVNVAEYDHLRGRFDDPSKVQAPKTVEVSLPAPLSGSNETYDEALRQKTWTEAERARLKLEEERRQLVRTVELSDAIAKCGEEAVRVFKKLVNLADEHASVVSKDGSRGLHLAYKAFTDRQCSEFADALIRLAALASDTDLAGEPDPSEAAETTS